MDNCEWIISVNFIKTSDKDLYNVLCWLCLLHRMTNIKGDKSSCLPFRLRDFINLLNSCAVVLLQPVLTQWPFDSKHDTLAKNLVSFQEVSGDGQVVGRVKHRTVPQDDRGSRPVCV